MQFSFRNYMSVFLVISTFKQPIYSYFYNISYSYQIPFLFAEIQVQLPDRIILFFFICEALQNSTIF